MRAPSHAGVQHAIAAAEPGHSADVPLSAEAVSRN